MNILVIDDEDWFPCLIKAKLKTYIEDGTVNFKYEPSPGKGLAFAIAEEWNIIIIDQHMPKTLGTEVLFDIKQSKPSQNVIMLSSDQSDSIVNSVKSYMNTDHFQKGPDLTPLMDIILAHV